MFVHRLENRTKQTLIALKISSGNIDESTVRENKLLATKKMLLIIFGAH